MFKNKRVPIIIVLVLVIFIIAIIWRIKKSSAESGKRPPMMTNVILGSILYGPIERLESLTGNVTSVQQANIYPKVSGNIERIYVDIGDYVKEGQVLALIDTTIYSQNVRQARANLSQANANTENARLSLERNQALLEQNLIAKQEVDNSRTAYNVALSQKEAAQAVLSNVQTQFGYCRVRAPFSGTITKKMFDPGAYVSSSAGSQSSIMFILSDLNRLKADVNLPEKDVSQLPNIKEIIITADAQPGMKFKGSLSKTSGAIDISTRTMETEISIENPGNYLKPGMFVNINIVLEKKANAALLPDYVVMNDDKGSYIIVVSQDSIASKKYIKTGIQANNHYEILSGTDGNDRIVFSGQNLVKEGSKVRIIK